MAPHATLELLKTQHEEWAPWLTVVQHILSHSETSEWEAMVPAHPNAAEPTRPLLSGATLILSRSVVDRFARGLIETAAGSGTAEMATLENVLNGELDALRLFTDSLCQRDASVASLAEARSTDTGALRAVAALLPLPFLQTCRQRWASSLPESWVDGYCSLCGAWPAFTEVRGIERTRHHRCSRCGNGWHARVLSCPYCGTVDHDKLASLVPAKGRNGIVEGCESCGGYVKTFTRLQGCPPAEVMLEDMASVELDLAAFAQGYARPAGSGYPMHVTVIDADARDV